MPARKAQPQRAAKGIGDFFSLDSTTLVSSLSPRRHTSHTTAYCLPVTHLKTYQMWRTVYCSITWKGRSFSQVGHCRLACCPRLATSVFAPQTIMVFSFL